MCISLVYCNTISKHIFRCFFLQFFSAALSVPLVLNGSSLKLYHPQPHPSNESKLAKMCLKFLHELLTALSQPMIYYVETLTHIQTRNWYDIFQVIFVWLPSEYFRSKVQWNHTILSQSFTLHLFEGIQDNVQISQNALIRLAISLKIRCRIYWIYIGCIGQYIFSEFLLSPNDWNHFKNLIVCFSASMFRSANK